MAGGKLSPRQRMINLMYLVLTALLALQVSDTIMEKFIFLNESLEHSKLASEKSSEDALIALKEKVAKDGNKLEGIESIKRAEKLKEETAKIINEIEKLKRQLRDEAGGGIDKHTNRIKNPKEEDKVAILMIGPEGSKNGKAYGLEKKLNDFVHHLYDEYKDLGFEKPKTEVEMQKQTSPFPLLATGNEHNPIYANDPINKGKDFAQSNFAQTPVVAALAILTQKQTEIIRYEQEVLKKLGAPETKEFKFDNIVATAMADANIVAAGTEYTARMFISASSKKQGTRMTFNGSPIKVNSEGVGEVKFIPSGNGQQSWTGSITINKGGRDTTFTFEKKFTVVEPVLLVNSESKFPLYQNCANPLETSVPALGANYLPSFSVTNGRAIPGASVGKVTLYPTVVGKCVLSVSSGGRNVGSTEFKVNPVPPPDVFLGSQNGVPLDLSKAIPGSVTIAVIAKPDETFANTLPREANYRITVVEVTLFRGGSGGQTKRFASGIIQLSQFETRPGDLFQVKVIGVQRITSFNELENVQVRQPYISGFLR